MASRRPRYVTVFTVEGSDHSVMRNEGTRPTVGDRFQETRGNKVREYEITFLDSETAVRMRVARHRAKFIRIVETFPPTVGHWAHTTPEPFQPADPRDTA